MSKNGKSFSLLEQTCLELATLNIKLNPLKKGNKINGNFAYVLFNKERTKAELFLPNQDRGIVLKKIAEGNWRNEDFVLMSWKGYVLQKNGQAVFGG